MAGIMNILQALSGQDHPMLVMLGKRIAALWVGRGASSFGQEEDVLVFVCGDERFAFSVEGDCCSTSYVTEIDGVDAIIGGTLTGLEQIEDGMYESNDDDDRYGGDFITPYAIRMETDKGQACITFHNSSNGYYGGWVQAAPVPDVMDGLVQITEDWG